MLGKGALILIKRRWTEI